MRIRINLLLNREPPSKLHILNAVHGGARLLHLLDGLEALVVLAGHLPAQKIEHADLPVERAQRDEVRLVRRERDARRRRARLFELVEVRRGLEGPEPRCCGRLPGLVRLPVLEEARGVGGEDCVVDVRVLRRAMSAVSLRRGERETHGEDVHGRFVQLFDRVEGIVRAPPIVNADRRCIPCGPVQKSGVGSRTAGTPNYAHCKQRQRLSAAVDPTACARSKPEVDHIDQI